MNRVVTGAFVGLLLLLSVTPTYGASTAVPGHQGEKVDSDNNGYSDVGEIVNGKYVSVYAYDSNGDWFWDLGDGRIQGTVSSMGDLDQSTLTRCDYQVQYRGTFENDPFMDSGWIINTINCSGYDDNGQYNSVIVHRTDPRFTGDPSRNVGWGPDWEYHSDTWSHEGNQVNPYKPV
jgi:hypothetical protein